MSELRPFQIALLAGFFILGVIGLIVLSTYSPGPSEEDQLYGDVLIWGTVSRQAMQNTLSTANDEIEGLQNVRYRQVDARDFEATLTNAIAEGQSPDLVLISHKQLVPLRTKLIPLGEQTVPLRAYRNSYIDGTEIFIMSDGTYALPVGVDPLVMYWNRDLFATNGLAQPPRTWEAVVNTVVPTLTQRNPNRDIITSAVSFGEYRNVLHATDILSLLMIQAGSSLVQEDNGRYELRLNETTSSNTRAPLTSALEFYTGFSNFNSSLYTWNRAQGLDRDEFAAGGLALYFGPGSEVSTVSRTNPNLNFDVAPVPQGADASIRRTYGTFYGFAIPRASRNPSGALAAATLLTGPTYAERLTNELDIAPASRALLGAGSSNPFDQVIYNEALAARAWWSPLAASTDTIFQRMVEGVTSNTQKVSEAVSTALQQLGRVY